jgi:hypothetical protein
VSANTIRRWIKAGELQAERVARPQGTAWHVHLPRHVPPGTSREVPASTSQHVPPAPPTGTSLAPGEQQRAAALGKYGADLLAPALDLIERLHAENRAQAETIGRLQAELATLQERVTAHSDQVAQQAAATVPTPESTPAPPAEAPHPWWRRWAWWRMER